MKTKRAFSKYKLALTLLLVVASLICLSMEVVHTRLNGRERYGFLVWNLFLAWIPFGAAVLASLAARNKISLILLVPLCTLVWLFFFPNAPYLLTDFQHLTVLDSAAPVWYDVVMFIWYAWTGLMLGVASLFLIHEIVTRLTNRFWGWAFAFGITCLSSVGVYLGRFLRWNSWDILQEPGSIFKDMYDLLSEPLANKSTYVFVILFTLLFLFIYVAFHLLGGAMRERASE
jgi:uncharacterized membrane protein